jgi:hypothetical protein
MTKRFSAVARTNEKIAAAQMPSSAISLIQEFDECPSGIHQYLSGVVVC